jgi:hypothetical protein
VDHWLKSKVLESAGWEGTSYYQLESMAFVALLRDAVCSHDSRVRSVNIGGQVPDDLDVEALLGEVGQVGYSSGFGESTKAYFWKDGIAILTWGAKKKTVTVSATTTSQNAVNVLEAIGEKLLPVSQAREVFVITKRGGDLYLDSIGMGAIELERENYDPESIENYDYVVGELKSTSPAGRLVLLAGPPGTGKTFMIRGFVGDVDKGTFVVVPPNMIAELGSPEIAPLLIEEKRRGEPIILILEDADEALIKRTKESGDKLPIISSVLNLGDGILGSLLDVRVIATTNAPKVRLDTAITRAGRLLKQITLDRLELKQAAQVFERLTDKALDNETRGEWGDKKASLADVYALARKHGWAPPKIEDEDEDEEE